MRVSRIRLDNYACFKDAPAIEFDSGVNFVVGKNNVGKSCLVKLLGGIRTGTPHESKVTKPDRNVDVSEGTLFEIEYTFSPNEMLQLLLAKKNRSLLCSNVSNW